MDQKPTDLFAKKSKSWDMNSKRVKNAKAIANTIVNNIKLDKDMVLMDMGAGTGLLTYFVAPFVKKIVAVDNSPSMLKEFESKRDEFACETDIILNNILTEESSEMLFDGIISSMTMHHIEDLSTLFVRLYAMLKKEGFIAIADLDSEDGTFHSDNTGVFHYGFDREVLKSIAKEAGFRDVRFTTASTIRKPHGDFTLFLMTARR